MTTKPGKLTLSGLLYEGSAFHAWKERLDATLHVRGLSDFDSSHAIDLAPANLQGARAESTCAIICANVSPCILSRIGEKVKCNPYILWQRLETLVTPLRFLDLPAQVRTSIYKLIGWHDQENIEISTRLPPITTVSRQLRQESRAAYYAENEFYVAITTQKPKDEDRAGWLEGRVRDWAETCLGDDAQHLRRFTIPYCFTYRTSAIQPSSQQAWCVIRNIMLRFSSEYGLQIEVDADEIHYKSDGPELLPSKVLTNECTEMLSRYAEKINRDRKTFNLKGGSAIIMAILSKPEMWGDGIFKWCDRTKDECSDAMK